MDAEEAGFYEETLARIREIVREELRQGLRKTSGAEHPSPPATEPSGRVLSGDVRHFRMPEVLQLVSLQRLTGRLSLWHGDQTVDVYMRDGRVAYATGEKRSRREQLGTILVNMGRITQAALEAALERGSKTGARLGRMLVEEGLVKKDDIRAALHKQAERSVYKAMAWDEGRFTFDICVLPDFVEDVPIAIRVEDLILEGVRRIEEGRVIAEKIPSLDIVFTKTVQADEELEGMGLKEDEKRVLGAVDGKRDVRELIEATGLAEFALMRALFALYSAGIVRKSAPALKAADRTQYL
ncbi:MAG: DUF4388 domain-containing protein [Nitrospirae bacterium]|nr:DUF4388 domain-containing protein [Nitrospirota bacterium]